MIIILLSLVSFALPDKVDSSLKANYPSLINHKVHRYVDYELPDKLLYEVSFFDLNNNYNLVYFNIYGEIIFKEEQINYDSLPSSISSQIGNIKIEYITKCTDYYYVSGFKDNVNYEYYFNYLGELLSIESRKRGIAPCRITIIKSGQIY